MAEYRLPYTASEIEEILGTFPDWNASEGEDGHILNRTHYEAVETVNEPLNLTWDGNTEGLVCVDDIFYKVSDLVFTDDEIKLMTITSTLEGVPGIVFADEWEEGISNGNIVLTDDVAYVFAVFFARKDGAVLSALDGSVTLPEKGVYFANFPDIYYVSSLTTTEPVPQPKTVVHKLDKKYLPDDIGGISKADLSSYLSLGIASDGLIYLFVDGTPVGTGIPQGQSGDVFGYVDENNTIVLTGDLADGTYSIKYEMDDDTTIDIGDLVLDSNVYYSVTKNLTNCTVSNSVTQVAEGESYSATITANDGYELSSVVVTMGGTAVTVSGGTINIASVTGNIVITAIAEVVEIVNQIPISTDASGNLYVGTNGEEGYKSGYRIRLSNGLENAVSGAYCTGFIPIEYNDTIYIKGITLHSTADYNAICFYDSSRTFIIGTNFNNSKIGIDGDVYSIPVREGLINALTADSGVAFVRFSCGSITDETIVTVNQEID